ncbi:hypothetical protein [Mucilaginibacter sp.]|uniref:hypothetical protein n=1 Tax=Mucilaginibacter sp. TaxID=1882438 RepID=UPI0025D9D7DE|nr:hypothetical protein [Mucilaginibacter sp.]
MKIIKFLCLFVLVIGFLSISMYFGDRRMHPVTHDKTFAIVGAMMVITSLLVFIIVTTTSSKNQKR